MKVKIQIKSVFGNVLFELEKENNTIRETLLEAIKQGANLRSANLCGANLPFIPINCPSDGAFVGWKKVYNVLIKLLIPEDAKRCSANTYKCRCDKAKVLEITSLDGNEKYESIVNTSYYPYVEYKVGEMVYPDKFDDDRWNECSNGIHFFINKQHAIGY